MIDSAAELSRLFRILSDETRLRVLRLLWREELTVNELAEITQLAQPRISNHLKILRDENLIVERREGSWRPYRVDHDSISPPAHALWPSLEAAWRDDPRFTVDDKHLAAVLAARADSIGADFFDQLARRWDEIRDRLFGDALGREILRSFIPPGLRVADVGTGTGYVLQLFANRCEKLIAIDNSEAMIAIARAKAEAAGIKNVEFRFANLEDAAPLAPEEVNLITLVQVIHHLEKPGDSIRHLAKGLQAGGRLIINDFVEHEEQWLRKEFHHRWTGFSRKQIMIWVEEAGLAVVSWDIHPGRAYISPEGTRLIIPASFTAVAGRVP